MTPTERAEDAFDNAQRGEYWGSREDVVKFVADAIRAAVAEEREACAKIVEMFGEPAQTDGALLCTLIAAHIRTRK